MGYTSITFFRFRITRLTTTREMLTSETESALPNPTSFVLAKWSIPKKDTVSAAKSMQLRK